MKVGKEQPSIMDKMRRGNKKTVSSQERKVAPRVEQATTSEQVQDDVQGVSSLAKGVTRSSQDQVHDVQQSQGDVQDDSQEPVGQCQGGDARSLVDVQLSQGDVLDDVQPLVASKGKGDVWQDVLHDVPQGGGDRLSRARPV